MKEFIQVLHTHKKSLLLLLATWGLYFVCLFGRMIQVKPDGFYVGHPYVWSDWAIHISLASIFAYKDPQYWFAYHPMYAGGQLTYPFLTNFISGMLMRIGCSVYVAFIIPSIIYTLVLVVGIYSLFYVLLKSQKQALIAILSFFLSSGPGFLKFLKDFWQNPNLEWFLYPPEEYSRLELYQWYTGNFGAGMLLPQRAFLLGMTLAVWVMTGLIYILLQRSPQGSNQPTSKKNQRIILVISGVLAGLLPITHMHSFIVIVIVTGLLCFVCYKQWKTWLYYAVPAGIISILLYLTFVSGGIENPNFIKWLPGWSAQGGFVSWVVMWLRIWGVMLPLAIAGIFLLKKYALAVKAVFWGFWLVFLLANVVLFQPTLWDNSKLFLWAYFGFSGLAAIALTWAWEYSNRKISRFGVVLLAVTLMFTGVLETIRLQRIDRNQVQLTSTEDIQLGQEIREKTHPLAIFLTAAIHNHPVTIWGVRPILMGYSEWVRNYGFLYKQREQDIVLMFQGGPTAEKLLKHYGVSYVAIGPAELYDFRANEAYYAQRYPVAFRNRNYRIYDVRSLAIANSP